MKPDLYIGYYSPKAAEIGGTSIWEDINGNEFEVTSICQRLETPPFWGDLITVSHELVRFLRKGKNPTRTLKISPAC